MYRRRTVSQCVVPPKGYTTAAMTLYLHKGRISLPFDRVVTTPTVSDVLQMCNELSHHIPISRRTLVKLRNFLPCMLEGAQCQMQGRDVTIPQYRGGMNTYDYFQQMEALDHKYDPENGNGRWLRSSARFLICWVAEQLKCNHSIGEGWRSVFYLGREKKQPERRIHTPHHCVTSPMCAHVANAEESLFTDEMEERFLEFQMGDAEVTDTVQEMVSSSGRQFRKPSKLVQSNRTLGKCFALRRHLRKRSVRKSVLHFEVKKWLTTTVDGQELLKACEVDPDAFDVDHVWPQSMGGPEVVENYHVMPCGANSFFRDMAWNNKEKRAYVGEEQVQMVTDLAVRARNEFDWSALTSA